MRILKAPFELPEHLFVSIQAEPRQPLFFRVSLRKVLSGFTLLAAVFFLTLTMSLFFFRELEINRRLQEKVLELETDNQLAQLQRGHAVILPAAPVSVEVPAASEPVPPIAQTLPAPREVTATQALEDRKVVAAKVEPSVAIFPRVGNLNTNCSETECEVNLSLVPSAPGTVQGELLLVMELEVPRIGGVGSSTGGTLRKSYVLYPGNISQDEINPARLDELEKKPFRFSRGLQTRATFETGKLLRPLAIHVYLFDTEQNVLHHERRVVEREESDDN